MNFSEKLQILVIIFTKNRHSYGMNSIRDTFVNNLKYYGNQKGISQEKFSYAVEKSIAYINQIEKDVKAVCKLV